MVSCMPLSFFKTKVLGLTGLSLLMCTSAFSQAPNPSRSQCVPQTQVDVTKIKPQVILVGEIHGTNEMPAFVSGLLCSLLQSGKSVILSLEREVQEQESLNRFITSEGTEADRRALTSHYGWRSKGQDGRSSEAMLALLEDVRKLRKSGHRIGVAATLSWAKIDIPLTDAENTPLSLEDNILYSSLNDRAMADSILGTAILYRQYTQVVLSGYGHTSNVRRLAWNAEFRPMGEILAGFMPVFTIGIESGGGARGWAVGGPYKESPVSAGKHYLEQDKIDAIVSLPRITASNPVHIAPVELAK